MSWQPRSRRRRHPAAFAWVLLVLGALEPPSCVGLSKEGHELINNVAALILTKEEVQQIKKLLKSDLVSIASWEEEISRKYTWTEEMHWHSQSPEWTCDIVPEASSKVQCNGAGAERGGLFCALVYLFEHFSHDMLLAEFPKSKDPVHVPQVLRPLTVLTTSEQTPANYLRWLVALMGDLHQPLHLIQDGDHGRNIQVRYHGSVTTLHDLWENKVFNQLRPATDASFLIGQYNTRAPEWWDQQPADLFRRWAKDVSTMGCYQILSFIKMQPAGPDPIDVSEATMRKWRDVAYELKVAGGQRLAFLLRQILEHRQHRAAHKEGRSRYVHKKNWKRNLATNLAIAAVVVPLLLVSFWLHLKLGGPGLRSVLRGLPSPTAKGAGGRLKD